MHLARLTTAVVAAALLASGCTQGSAASRAEPVPPSTVEPPPVTRQVRRAG